MAKKKTTKATDILGVLRAKKEQDGKLSKFGEWVLMRFSHSVTILNVRTGVVWSL